jgi:hypothetical protein
MLAMITTDLDKIAPRFEIQPEQIEILRTPTEFYETLKVGFRASLLLCYTTTTGRVQQPSTLTLFPESNPGMFSIRRVIHLSAPWRIYFGVLRFVTRTYGHLGTWA